MKLNETNQILPEKISIFDEVLENINTNEVELIIDKISKNLRLDGLMEDDEIKYEQEMSSSNRQTLDATKIKSSRFPCYDGSFKHDINEFLKNEKNKDLNKLYEIVLREIQRIYLGYIHIENKLYTKINQYIKFSESKNNTPMEIISKLKEISETLSDTIKFIEKYLFQNFVILKKIFTKIDRRLANNFEVESISLFYLLDIFDLPNNELSYILMFKIIDEVSCILKYIAGVLDNQIKAADPKVGNLDNNDSKSTDNEAYLMDNNSSLNNEAYKAMINIKNKYIKQINESLNNIDSYSFYRAKYYNKYIFTKGNYEVDTNLFLNKIIEDNDDNNEEFLPLNSLMDEELIINRFINKSIINKFLKFFKSKLPSSFKTNERLIILHNIQYNIILVFVIYWYRRYDLGFLDISIFYLGRIFSKILFNSLIKKRKSIKALLIISNAILLISFLILMIGKEEDYYKWIIFSSRFLIGLSYSKNIETKFILNYVPKLLVKKEIKKYYSYSYLSLCFGFILISVFNFIFSFLETENIEKELSERKLDINNVGEIIVAAISLIILIINIIFFREPKNNDIMKININKKTNNNESFDITKKSNINSINENENKITTTPSKSGIEDKKDATSIFSYGKAKLISFKEKSKAKQLEENIKLNTEQKNYEGTNKIFSILEKLIIEEKNSSDSYTNKATKGFILLYTTLYIISSIVIFYNPLFNLINRESNYNEDAINVFDSKNKIWMFGLPYLLSFFIYVFKLMKLSSDIFIWNIMILIFLSFEIALNLVFIVFDKTFFENSPIFFDNYYFFGFLSLILFFNILIEICCIKVMIREIPIEKKISSINIDNFLDIYECLIKAFTFGGLYFLTYCSFLTQTVYIKFIIEILYIIGLIIFVVFNFKRRQVALTKIINKITYESF